VGGSRFFLNAFSPDARYDEAKCSTNDNNCTGSCGDDQGTRSVCAAEFEPASVALGWIAQEVGHRPWAVDQVASFGHWMAGFGHDVFGAD
jgi:hypothetical protein